MDDLDYQEQKECALCGKAEGDSSNLTSQSQLQTNATVGCGHQFCISCIESQLSRQRQFPCPICETLVKRVNLSTRTLDDVLCEKDTSWRHRILRTFNKTQEDFSSLLEYNDYLEEVEDMIYSIVHEEQTADENKAKLKECYDIDKEAIKKRLAKKTDKDYEILDKINAEQREADRRKRELEEEDKVIAMTKKKFKQESAEVLLGERDEVSAELKLAQMTGYRNELKRQREGRQANSATVFVSPRVRELKGTENRKENMYTKEFYLKRQAAGGGIPNDSDTSFKRNWNETISTMFAGAAF